VRSTPSPEAGDQAPLDVVGDHERTGDAEPPTSDEHADLALDEAFSSTPAAGDESDLATAVQDYDARPLSGASPRIPTPLSVTEARSLTPHAAPVARPATPLSVPSPRAATPEPALVYRDPTPIAVPAMRSATPYSKPAPDSDNPLGDGDSEFIDLGEWLRNTEPARSTRMQVEDPKPTGDEKADFEEMLRRFKRGVAENVEAEDYEAHYDLGVAYKEMGLIDEAIAQFQQALRDPGQRVRSYEALGQCFVEKEQYPIAAALLQRATEVSGTDDQQLVGVLYLLGFSLEHLDRPAEAVPYYLRVFAVDIEFRDVAERVAALGKLTK
jgi:hypothetical protein